MTVSILGENSNFPSLYPIHLISINFYLFILQSLKLARKFVGILINLLNLRRPVFDNALF